MSFDAVVKVGGSLAEGEGSSPLALVQAMAELAREYRLLAVPGGAAFAAAVRAAYARFRLSEPAAHRMALLAMDQYGLLLADLTPESAAVTTLAEARAVAAAGWLPVLLPATWLLAADPLENSWRVTSDAIAAWVAAEAGARLLVLAKDVDGACAADPRTAAAAPLLRRVAARELAGREVVDPVFPEVLRTPCWILNGRHPERLGHLLRHGTTTGTEVIPCNCSSA